MDSIYGLTVYKVTGVFDGRTLELFGNPTHSEPGTGTESIRAKAILTPQGNLRGEWSRPPGTAGTFELNPHDFQPADQNKVHGMPIPEQLHTVRRSVGAVRLYREDILDLVGLIRKDFSVGRLIVTYKLSGVENTRYFEDFENEASSLGELQYVKISIQEPEAQGINKLSIVELNSENGNDILVQSIYESWAIGKAEALTRKLRRYEKNLVTNTKKYGVGLNQVMVLAMLLLFPVIETLWRRVIFAVIVVGLVLVLVLAHKKFLPSVVVFMSPQKTSVLERS